MILAVLETLVSCFVEGPCSGICLMFFFFFFSWWSYYWSWANRRKTTEEKSHFSSHHIRGYMLLTWLILVDIDFDHFELVFFKYLNFKVTFSPLPLPILSSLEYSRMEGLHQWFVSVNSSVQICASTSWFAMFQDNSYFDIPPDSIKILHSIPAADPGHLCPSIMPSYLALHHLSQWLSITCSTKLIPLHADKTLY